MVQLMLHMFWARSIERCHLVSYTVTIFCIAWHEKFLFICKTTIRINVIDTPYYERYITSIWSCKDCVPNIY